MTCVHKSIRIIAASHGAPRCQSWSGDGWRRAVTAFLCTESEILDRTALAAYIRPVRDALVAAGGCPAVISSIGGKVVALVGEAPRNLVVSQWQSLAAAQAWLKSAELAALEPQRAQAYPRSRQHRVDGPAEPLPPRRTSPCMR